MAGSFHHCKQRNNRFRFDLIENMGDAHEACEHMFYMIMYLTKGNQTRIDTAALSAYKLIIEEKADYEEENIGIVNYPVHKRSGPSRSPQTRHGKERPDHSDT